MKKLFLVLAAAFAMVACQTDINEVGVVGGEVDVTFEVGTPTRAYSDGTTATHSQYAVYEGETELTALTVTDGEIHGSTTVELKLVTGNTYTVIFWAAAPNAPYSVNWATGTMTVDYSAAVCNAENRDAFYKRHTFTVKGAQTETIELRRPFAQLNIGTNDYTKATEAGYTPVNSAVKVTNVYNTLNLWDGKVSNPVEVNFNYAEIAKGETFPVTGYQYLAMNYLLVPAEKEVVDIEFGYTETDENAAKTRTVGSVPVQRNYRTNIYGQLLTSDVDINVEIKPEYKDEHNVESGLFSQVADVVSLQEAIDTAPVGELTTIILTEDIDLSATRALGYITRVENGSNIVIDGNGHTIKGGIRIVGQSIKQNETTVIRNINFVTDQNELDFIASSDFGFGDNFWRYANNVTVENCTFTAATLSADPKVVGVRFNKAYNVTVKNCEGTNLHSLCQFQSNDTAIVLEGLKAVNCKNGISLGTTKKVTINGLEIEAQEYGLRLDGNSLQSGTRCSLNVANATITAAQPIIVRKVTEAYDLTLGENVALNSTELHQVVFTTTSDDVRPYVAPAEGKYTFNSAADYIVFPVVGNADVKVAEGLYYVNNTKTYLVANAEGLIAASAQTIKERETVALVADIDLAGKTFNGLNAFNPENNNTFDGQGHIVSNWTNEAGLSDLGFIANWVGTIKNVTIKNAKLKTSGRSAIVAGKVYGNIENCHVVESSIVDSYWACGIIAGHYNAGSISGCTVTDSSVKSNGGVGGIVGVINETPGTRGVYNCTVANTTVHNTGVYGEGYSAALVCGMINISGSTVELKGNTLENNTKEGQYVGDLYYNANGNTVVVE